MVNGADPCSEGLTIACFKEQPEHAKQILAYRMMEMLVGAEYMKRLQTFKGLPLPISMAADMGMPAGSISPLGDYSALSPFLVCVWDGGPVHLTQAQEGDPIMATVRRAKISFAGAENKEIIAAVPGFLICIATLALTVAGQTNLTLNSDDTALSGALDLGGTNEPRGLTHTLGDYPLKTASGEAFKIDSSLAVQVSGFTTYFLEPA